jgi:hypothetical protein
VVTARRDVAEEQWIDATAMDGRPLARFPAHLMGLGPAVKWAHLAIAGDRDGDPGWRTAYAAYHALTGRRDIIESTYLWEDSHAADPLGLFALGPGAEPPAPRRP